MDNIEDVKQKMEKIGTKQKEERRERGGMRCILIIIFSCYAFSLSAPCICILYTVDFVVHVLNAETVLLAC